MKRRPDAFLRHALSENDARELDLFERFLRHRAADPKKTDKEHYADVYGEVIFDATGSPEEPGKP